MTTINRSLNDIYQKHREEAARANFDSCGCDWCEAYRKHTHEVASREIPVNVQDQEMGLLQWLKTNHPEVFTEQKHLEEGTPERVYWHYGRWVALRDVKDATKPVMSELEIGKYTLSKCPHGGIWITSPEGDGGQFQIIPLEAAIAAFYKEHF